MGLKNTSKHKVGKRLTGQKRAAGDLSRAKGQVEGELEEVVRRATMKEDMRREGDIRGKNNEKLGANGSCDEGRPGGNRGGQTEGVVGAEDTGNSSPVIALGGDENRGHNPMAVEAARYTQPVKPHIKVDTWHIPLTQLSHLGKTIP